MDPKSEGNQTNFEVEENVINIIVIRQDDGHQEYDTVIDDDTNTFSPGPAVPFVSTGMIQDPETSSAVTKRVTEHGSLSNTCVSQFSPVSSQYSNTESLASSHNRPPLYKSQSFTVTGQRLTGRKDLSTDIGNDCSSPLPSTPVHRKVRHASDVLESIKHMTTPVRLRVIKSSSPPVHVRKFSKHNSISLPVGSPREDKNISNQVQTSSSTVLSPVAMSHDLKQSSVQNLTSNSSTPDSGFFTPRIEMTSSSLAASPLSTPRITNSGSNLTVKIFMKSGVSSSVTIGSDSMMQETESPLMFSQQPGLASGHTSALDSSELPTNNLAIPSSVEQSINSSIPFVGPPPLVMGDWTFSPIVPFQSSMASSSTVPSLCLPSTNGFQAADKRKALEELELNKLQPSVSTPRPKPKPGVERPNFSYMDLIKMALKDSEDGQMTLREILSWIESRFPFFRHDAKASWKSSIRHNLSLHRDFMKVDEKKHGGKWKLVEGAKGFMHKLPKPPITKAKSRSPPPKPAVKSTYKSGQQMILPKAMPFALVPIPLASFNQFGSCLQNQPQPQDSPIQHQQRFPIMIPQQQPIPLPMPYIPLQQLPQPHQLDPQSNINQLVSEQPLPTCQQTMPQQNSNNILPFSRELTSQDSLRHGNMNQLVSEQPLQNYQQSTHQLNSNNILPSLEKSTSQNNLRHDHSLTSQKGAMPKFSSPQYSQQSREQVSQISPKVTSTSSSPKVHLPSSSKSRKDSHIQNNSTSDLSKQLLLTEQGNSKIISADGQIMKPVGVEVFEDDKTRQKKIVFYMKHPPERERKNTRMASQGELTFLDNSVVTEPIVHKESKKNFQPLTPTKQRNICKMLDKIHTSKSFNRGTRPQHLKLPNNIALKDKSLEAEVNHASSLTENVKRDDRAVSLSTDEHLDFEFSHLFSTPGSLTTSNSDSNVCGSLIEEAWAQANISDKWGESDDGDSTHVQEKENPWNCNLNVPFETPSSQTISWQLPLNESSVTIPSIALSEATHSLDSISDIKSDATFNLVHCNQGAVSSLYDNYTESGTGFLKKLTNQGGSATRLHDQIIKENVPNSENFCSIASQSSHQQSQVEDILYSSSSIGRSLNQHNVNTQGNKNRIDSLVVKVKSQSLYRASSASKIIFPRSFSCDKEFLSSHSTATTNTTATRPSTSLSHTFSSGKDSSSSPRRHLKFKSQSSKSRRKQVHTPLMSETSPHRESRDSVTQDSFGKKCFQSLYQPNHTNDHHSAYRQPDTTVADMSKADGGHCLPGGSCVNKSYVGSCSSEPDKVNTVEVFPVPVRINFLAPPTATGAASTSQHSVGDPGENPNVSPSHCYRMPAKPFTTSPNTSLILTPSSQSLSHFLSLTSTPPVGSQVSSTSPHLEEDQLLPQGILQDQSNSSSFLDSSLFDNLDSLFEAKTP